ncbi:hypothetical protein FA15DRAFT_669890 [Coprinopsis marcescibilis]|uniref:Uncharacterized protein n=1 Tax=Coprinopsis marcescibilis TaxID=230819 RepID=A0A5C3L7B2_COPMA|nr:hypothetical protein FA15DRAFT_669890 [Coprinopsis marcescibilis]
MESGQVNAWNTNDLIVVLNGINILDSRQGFNNTSWETVCDQVYLAVLEQIPLEIQSKVADALGCLVTLQEFCIGIGSYLPISRARICEAVFGWDPAILESLQSLVRTDEHASQPVLYHPVFLAFLLNPSRSKQFCFGSFPHKHIPHLLVSFLQYLTMASRTQNFHPGVVEFVAHHWHDLYKTLYGVPAADIPQDVLHVIAAYNFPFDDARLTHEGVDFDNFILGPLSTLPVKVYPLLKMSLGNSRSAVDRKMRATLSHLIQHPTVSSQGSSCYSLERHINAIFPQNLLPTTRGESAFALLDRGCKEGIIHGMQQIGLGWAVRCVCANNLIPAHWKHADLAPIILFGSLNPELIAFLATPARPKEKHWPCIDQDQLIAAVQSCLDVMPIDATWGPGLQQNAVSTVASLVTLIEDPDGVIPSFTQFYDRCDVEEFDAGRWTISALQCVFRDNKLMARALIHFLKKNVGDEFWGRYWHILDAYYWDPAALAKGEALVIDSE